MFINSFFIPHQYASNAGKYGREFYTPADVAELPTRFGTVGKTEINKVYESNIRNQYNSAIASPPENQGGAFQAEGARDGLSEVIFHADY